MTVDCNQFQIKLGITKVTNFTAQYGASYTNSSSRTGMFPV